MNKEVVRLADRKYWHRCAKCYPEKYRYALYRCVEASSDKGTVMFIMLNPSEAHETNDTQNDRTIRRCIDFAKQWGYGQLVVGNLSPLQASKPEKLKATGPEPDCVWKANLDILERLATIADSIVLAWGDKGVWEGRDTTVKRILQCFVDKLYYLGTTKQGHPSHPRGPMPYSQTLRPWRDVRGHQTNT